MPELPDVEIFKRYLDATALHQTIDRVEINDSMVLDHLSRQALIQTLRGRQLESSRRHGKPLWVALDRGPYVTLHFGMTGYLKYFRDPGHSPTHVRLLLGFSNGYHLAYVSQRKLGRVGLTDDLDQFIQDKGLGPDALDLELEGFKRVLAERRGMIKATLMNQRVLAGLGNVYTDEILFHCGLHPRAQTNSITAPLREKLYQAMQGILEEAINRRVENFPDSWLINIRHKGGKCPKGHGPLERVKVAGRHAYCCLKCQPPPD